MRCIIIPPRSEEKCLLLPCLTADNVSTVAHKPSGISIDLNLVLKHLDVPFGCNIEVDNANTI